jgi:hypothetical protein
VFDSGEIAGPVLDTGCAATTRGRSGGAGFAVLGIDFAPAAIQKATEKGEAREARRIFACMTH